MANRRTKNEERNPDAGHTFEDYVKRALNPMLVLHLLSESNMYVYQMQQEMARRSGGRYVLSLLYPVLYRLVKLGYAQEGEKRISEDNRVRQYYEITSAGREYLDALKTEFNELAQAARNIMEYVPEEGEEREFQPEPVFASGGAIADRLSENRKAQDEGGVDAGTGRLRPTNG